MAASRVPKSWVAFIGVVLLLLVGLGALQVWSAMATRDLVRDAISAPLGPANADIQREKDRQEAIGKRIENSSKALLQANLASGLGAALGVLISASGAVLAVFTYMAARQKEHEDRQETQDKERRDRLDAQEKDRQDRFAAALSETLGRLVNAEPRQRAVGAAGLLPFFGPERADFHLQALSALVAAARIEDEPPEVRQALRLALEQAAGAVDPALLRKLSWQGVKIPTADLRGRDLAGLDLRDTDLRDARLEQAVLDGADLTNAQLQGSQMVGTRLVGANLTYADLAGASLAKAHLSGCRLTGAKVLNLELEGADLRGVGEGWRGIPWDAARNWRKAIFDDDAAAELIARYGAEAPDLSLLMLMWEAPPYVAGGTWTACYHMVRRLRRRGVDVTVVVPWERSLIEDNPFGLDVPILALGITPSASDNSAYAAPAWSSYGSAGGYAGSAYGGAVYGGLSAYGPYGPYGGAGLAGSILFGLIGEFRRRLEAQIIDLKPDVIHAHDWVTFEAARMASERTGAPWVAHFHSTERDRRPDNPDELTLRIERMAVDSAQALVVPGEGTRQRLIDDHGAKAKAAWPIANLLSDGPPATGEMGRFETRRVVFLGRLSAQKGLDRFGALADAVRARMGGVRFDVFGSGEDQHLVWRHNLGARGALPWSRRGEAFAGASVAVVPSRSEPFGMVVLEAMQHRTPVLYPAASGAAEVLESGNKVDPANIDAMAGLVVHLLSDLGAWELTVRAQAAEIDAYPLRPDDDRLIAVWRAVAGEGVRGG